ncbi:cyclophilin-like fold protein [Microlunatus ginsengisoli]|uniref:Cyclophilin-like domain-containing protein n=1 Tax=Microlunatus ginsengisoli TaxID=363863 RepID=A0ABP6ZHU4_9ACTN
MTVIDRRVAAGWRARGAAAVVGLVTVAAGSGCAVGVPGVAQDAASSDSGVAGSSSRQIVLRFDDQVVPATLADNPTARAFAALLPLTLDLRDPMGQAKSGRLPVPLGSTDGSLVTRPAVAGVYYGPRSQTFAVFYCDLGQSVPDGLVPLGTINSDLGAVAAAGQRIRLRIYPGDHAGS